MSVEFKSKPKMIFEFVAGRNRISVFDDNTYKSDGLSFYTTWRVDENRNVWFKHLDRESNWRNAEDERRDYEKGEKIFADFFIELYEEYINKQIEKEVFDVNTDSK
jgi:hypothetical protein